MKIDIADDFDLWKIANCGQAFRVRQFEDGSYRFVTGEHVLYITHKGLSDEECDTEGYDIEGYDIEGYDFSLKQSMLTDKELEKEWAMVWKPYFDLDRNYSSIRSGVNKSDKFLSNACECGKGLRILRQDPWEMLLTFITSQRKSIPAIKSSIEKVCEKYGKKVTTKYETFYLFPTAFDMREASADELKNCGLGYRVDYYFDAIQRVIEKSLDLEILRELDYESLFNGLKIVKGVGDKVSNCICLFAYAKTEAAPVDTWIAKVIDRHYSGINPFPSYGEVAGIMQQYIFYYAQMHKEEF